VLLNSAGLARGAQSIGLALATLAVVLVVALRYGEQMSRAVFVESREALLLQVFGLALLIAGAAERLQVSAAVGAFLVGIALSGRVAEGAREVLSPLRDLFAAAFFLFFGLSTDPGSLPPALPAALALSVAGILTKVASGWYAARRAGIAPAGRIRAGAALAPRGEFSIVIATLAVGAGVNAHLGPLAAAYVLLMAVIGPLLPRAFDPLARRAGRRAARRGARRRAEAGRGAGRVAG
jgi:CPA2 family monovalent cation:H+ antiporter-2